MLIPDQHKTKQEIQAIAKSWISLKTGSLKIPDTRKFPIS
jgi:hypothetical protein